MKWHFIFLHYISMFVNAQVMFMPSSIQDNIFKQFELFPQEKLHLHTDRTMYVSGEKIWFKAYLVDAYSHKFPTYSQYVYVELISSSDSLVQRVMISPDENGLFHGHIFLSELLSEGNYTIRAYTRAMENLGDDYFFTKNIQIGWIDGGNGENRGNGGSGENPSLPFVSEQERNGDDYEVSFFPEGGYLTEGVINLVAFKAINRNGASEIITGEIVDNENNVVVADVKTVFAGMGSFPLGATPGKSYFLVSTNSAGQVNRFPLPSAKKTCTITTLHRDNQFIVMLKKSPDIPQRALYVLIHNKGEVVHYSQWDYGKGYISMSGDQLPSGVIQILLLDEQLNPISERLIFNNARKEQANLAFSTDKDSYGKREKVIATIKEVHSLSPSLSGRDGVGLLSHLSIAITDNSDISIDSLNTISASLLLSSELRGYIESPGYYLQETKEAAYALDHLMMTHGWRRYELSEVIKGNYKHPVTEFELTKEISGSVKTYLAGRPVVNREVMLIPNNQSMMRTTTDSDGKFRFALHYPDSASFFVMANNPTGRENVKITLNPEVFPKLKNAPVSRSLFPAIVDKEREQTIDFISKAEKRAQYDEDIKVVNLAEIEVTANRIKKKDELRLSTNPFNSSADITLYREELKQRMPNRRFTADFLWLVAGAKVDYNIFTKEPMGVRVGTGQGYALIYIDGLPSTIDELNAIPSDLIESIDIFKGASASLYGVRGANGIVSVTTGGVSLDNSKDLKSNAITFAPLGFQKPVEFFAPKYDTPESKNFGIPDYRTTIYWKPDLLVSEEGKESFEFYTSDFPTTYSVVIEGMTQEGKIIRQVERIEVR